MRGSIIGAGVFHFRVRDGAGWFNVASVTLKQDRNSLIRKIGMNEHLISNHELLVKKLKHFWLISSTRLKPLLALHLYPICGVVSPEPLAACAATIPNLEDGFALICLQRLSKLGFSYPAMQLTPQPVHQSPILRGPLVLSENPLKYRTPTADKDQTVSRRFEPSSRTTLIGEQPNPWELLHPQDVMSRHRGAKPCRRYGRLGRISLLSLE